MLAVHVKKGDKKFIKTLSLLVDEKWTISVKYLMDFYCQKH